MICFYRQPQIGALFHFGYSNGLGSDHYGAMPSKPYKQVQNPQDKFRLREMRLRAGLTQSDLSEKIDVTPATIGRWERGDRDPSIADMQQLAAALGCRISELFSDAVTLSEQQIDLLAYAEEYPNEVQTMREMLDKLRNSGP